MVITTREYLSLIKRGTPESLAQYQKEIERLEGIMLTGVRNYDSEGIDASAGTSKPEQYVEALEKIRDKYNSQMRLYEEERSRCLMNIQHLPTRDQSQAVYLYVIEDKSWEKIAIERNTTFEAARALCLRGFDSYERMYGSEIEIDDRIYRS